MARRNLYPQATNARAPSSVRNAINRFRTLPADKRASIPLLWWLLGGSTQPLKMSKVEAAYVDDARVGRAAIPIGDTDDVKVVKIPPGQTCANCLYAYMNVPTGITICAAVRGKIRPGGWCRFYAKAADAKYDPDRFSQE